MRTWLAAVAACSAALVAASSAGAEHRLVVVRPGVPVVGKRTTIDVAVRSRRALVLELVSPTGVHRRVRLRNVARGQWRATYNFLDDGQWILHVLPTRLARSIWVEQPPSALPPYRPSHANAPGITGVLGQGTLVFP